MLVLLDVFVLPTQIPESQLIHKYKEWQLQTKQPQSQSTIISKHQNKSVFTLAYLDQPTATLQRQESRKVQLPVEPTLI